MHLGRPRYGHLHHALSNPSVHTSLPPRELRQQVVQISTNPHQKQQGMSVAKVINTKRFLSKAPVVSIHVHPVLILISPLTPQTPQGGTGEQVQLAYLGRVGLLGETELGGGPEQAVAVGRFICASTPHESTLLRHQQQPPVRSPPGSTGTKPRTVLKRWPSEPRSASLRSPAPPSVPLPRQRQNRHCRHTPSTGRCRGTMKAGAQIRVPH